jgi:S-adenosylmethionine hydrolase
MIALFTDFGTHDAYVAQLKGAILSINPYVALIDLSHDVGPFHIRQAAYLLEKSARYFPAGTIFVAVVDPGVGSVRRPLLVHTQAHKFYIGPDNGLFTYVLERELLQAAYVLQQTTYFLTPHVSATFHGRDIFGPVAAHLSLGVDPVCFGPCLTEVATLPRSVPLVVGRTIEGKIVHIDHFGNMLTNIPSDLLSGIQTGQEVSITMQGMTQTVPFLITYAEGQKGQFICLISSDNEFEVACTQGSASDYFAAHTGDCIVLSW